MSVNQQLRFVKYEAIHTDSVTKSLQRVTRPISNKAAAHSASVKKEEDGKWKVDTSYIGYRTGDTDNLTRTSFS